MNTFETLEASGFAEAMRNMTEEQGLEISKEAAKMQVQALNNTPDIIEEKMKEFTSQDDGLLTIGKYDHDLLRQAFITIYQRGREAHSEAIQERVNQVKYTPWNHALDIEGDVEVVKVDDILALLNDK